MRFLVMLLVFVMVAPTVVGSMIIPLTDPSWGFDAWQAFPYLAGLGLIIALPISYFISGMIVSGVKSAGERQH